MTKLAYKNKVCVAAHRGNSKYFPENTMVGFRSAAALNPDMIENDIHMTKDGELIVMHDHVVDRTTNGTGLIREKTLAEIRELDAGSWKGEEFKGEKVPTLREFLDFFADYPEMLFNIELKDYPRDSGDFAYESAEKTLAMLREYGVMDRCVINTWSGELNEYLANKYGDEIKIHAYFPQEIMNGKQKRYVYDYAYCVCLFGPKEAPVVPKSSFDYAKANGVETWVYYKEDTEELYDAALSNGATLFTSNDPAYAMEILRARGLHD